MQSVPEGVIQAPESPDAPEKTQSVQTEYRQWHLLAIRL